MGIEPMRRESQSLMLPLHHKLHKLVPPERFELPTRGFEDRHSVQLSYRGKLGAGNENRTRNLTLAKLCVTTSTMPA